MLGSSILRRLLAHRLACVFTLHARRRACRASSARRSLSCRLRVARSRARTPFTVEDLVRLQRVADPAISPDGRTVVFSVRETDMAANRGRMDLWSLDLATKGAQPRRLTTHPENDSSPEWSGDGRDIYFLSDAQRLQPGVAPAGQRRRSEQVTDLPLDVGSFQPRAQRRAHRRHAGRVSPTAPISPAPASALKQSQELEGHRRRSTTASSCATGTPGATAASRSCSCSS